VPELEKRKLGNSDYLPELDGIRALAILMVMAIHARVPHASGGFIGVDLFFVLSGYLITSLLMKEHRKTGTVDFKRFYWRRCLRLLPALTALLVIYVIFGLNFQLNRSTMMRDVTIVFFYAASWSRALYNIPSDWLGHTWSLSIEEQFYFIWPAILILIINCNLVKKITLLSIIAISVCVYRYYLLFNNVSTDRIYFGFDTRIDTTLYGCMLAFLLSYDSVVAKITAHRRILNVFTALSISFLVWVLTCFSGEMRLFYSIGFALTAVSAAVVVLQIIVNKRGILACTLRKPGLVYTGKISYGLYIWHWPIFNYLHAHTHLPSVAKIVTGFIAAYVVSMLSYHLMEQPLLKFKDSFFGRKTFNDEACLQAS
jgi:peptidoglycan/LPS O-acetylase OafA/YrhL